MPSLKQKINEAFRRVLVTTHRVFSDYDLRLYKAATSLGGIYVRTNNETDLANAIEAYRVALAVESSESNLRADLLLSFNDLIRLRFVKSQRAEDMDEGIQIAQELVEKVPKDDSRRLRGLLYLGQYLTQRYSAQMIDSDQEEDSDREEALTAVREAISIAPQNYSRMTELYECLIQLLAFRFDKFSGAADLEEAISVYRRLANPPLDSRYFSLKKKIHWLHRLARQLTEKARHEGEEDASRESISMIREALLLEEDEEGRAFLLMSLGEVLSTSGTITGDSNHLQEAITVLLEAISLKSRDEYKAISLHVLAKLLSVRFRAIGALKDIQDSIKFQRMSISMTESKLLPQLRSDLAMFLGQLASTPAGSIHDREEAISILRDVASHELRGLKRSSVLLNLTRQLFVKFVGSTNYEKIIVHLEDILSRHGELKERGKREDLRELHHEMGLDILEEGLEVAQQAVDAASSDDVLLSSMCKYYLGLWLHSRNQWSTLEPFGLELPNTSTDMDAAPRVLKEAISNLPEKHPNRTSFLHTLAKAQALVNKVMQTPREEYRIGVLLNLQNAMRASTSSESSRIGAAKEALETFAESLDWQQAYEAAKIIIDLISKLTPQSLTASDKQRKLITIAGLASAAAAVALKAGKPPVVALGFLEQGRQALMTSNEHLRTNLLELERTHPDLAQQFVRLQKELEDLHSSEKTLDLLSIDDVTEYALQGTADRRHVASDEFERLIDNIRGKTGFENFLLPLKEEDMRAAAKDGPLVVLNVSEYCCDAILVETQQIRLVNLPKLKHDDVNNYAQGHDLSAPPVLAWLWDTIASPVLDALGYVRCPQPGEQWPRLWWIPTGVLSRFPLHASGRHNNGSLETVLDRVMSSYSLTIQTIVQGRQRPTSVFSTMNALLVAAKDTVNVNTLKYTHQEVEEVKGILTPVISECIVASDHRDQVIAHLPHCGIFHFAGHGLTDEKDPLKSHLLLATEDRRADPFTVETLLKLNLRNNPPFLAYLSACETGRVNDVKQVDENIHLISAFQFAGFRHVIGTLWEVKDKVCKNLAVLTYKEIESQLHENEVTDISICQALHRAIRTQREEWLKELENDRNRRRSILELRDRYKSLLGDDGDVPQRDIVSAEDDDEIEGAVDWVPYIHFGV
ncbi:CHAT domain-containing protein [Xylaria curta]|nr:CHAT domain-containing protein [Xylaria curta]